MILAMKYNLIWGRSLAKPLLWTFLKSSMKRGIDMSNHIAECSENECESVKCEQVNSQQEDCLLECPETFLSRNNRTLLEHGIYLSPIAETSLYVSDNDPSTDFCSHTELSLLERFHRIRENSLSRLSNTVSISTLGLIRDQFPGSSFRWRYGPSPSIALDLHAPLKQSDSQPKWIILRSYSPSGFGSISSFPAKGHFWGSIVLIVFVPMLVMVQFSLSQEFFPYSETPQPMKIAIRKLGT